MYQVHSGQMRVHGKLDGLGEQRDFAGRLYLPHRADSRCGVMLLQAGRGLPHPIRPLACVRIPGVFLLGQHRVHITIIFG